MMDLNELARLSEECERIARQVRCAEEGHIISFTSTTTEPDQEPTPGWYQCHQCYDVIHMGGPAPATGPEGS